MPAGRLPRAARERVAKPPAGTALAYAFRIASGMRPSLERDSVFRNGNGDECQIRSLNWSCRRPCKPLETIHFMRVKRRICSPPHAWRPQPNIELKSWKRFVRATVVAYI